MLASFWSPISLGAAFLILGALAPQYIDVSRESALIWAGIAAVLVGIAWWLARRHLSREQSQPTPRGGRGGTAQAPGQKSRAFGGAGGDANGGVGGDGGNAIATGKGARAKGGAGGKG
jgi:hypothetical protein